MSEMIRVLNVLFEERVGGPQLRVLQVAQALRARGYETTVALPKGDPQFAQLLAKHGIPFIELDLMRLRRTFDLRLHFRFVARFWSNVSELRRLIRDAGRIPAQRSTEYELVRVYGAEEDAEDSPLDHIEDAEARFGSYRKLTTSGQFRFLHPLRTSTPS